MATAAPIQATALPPKPPDKPFAEIKSFASIVKGDKDEMLISRKVPYVYKGEPAIFFSEQEVQKLAAPFEFALVGKLSRGRPTMEGSTDGLLRFWENDEGQNFYDLHASRVETCNTYDTCCTLASCIAAEMAKGSPVLQAVKVAKNFINSALEYSKDIVMGNRPQGPLDHLYNLKNHVSNTCRQRRFDPNDLFLYAVTNSRMNKKWGHSITDAVKAAIKGGLTIIQLRDLADFGRGMKAPPRII